MGQIHDIDLLVFNPLNSTTWISRNCDLRAIESIFRPLAVRIWPT